MRIASVYDSTSGGVHSVFSNLNLSLAKESISVEQVWSEDLRRSERLSEQRDAARELIERLKEYDVVIFNSLTCHKHMTVCRHLNKEVRRYVVVHNITLATYAAARAITAYADAVLCVSPRIASDLTTYFGVPRHLTSLCPSGVPYPQVIGIDERGSSALYVGRLEHKSKGVLLLPDIMSSASPDTELNIVGDGPDRHELLARLKRSGVRLSGVM